MLYTVASGSWEQGESLTPAMARGGLHRKRPKPEEIVVGGLTLAVALRYDETRGQVVAVGMTARGDSGPWSAPAIVDSAGRVLVLAAIPAALVRVIGAAEIRVHGETHRAAVPRAHIAVGAPITTGRVRVVDGRAVRPTFPRSQPKRVGKPESSLGPSPPCVLGDKPRSPKSAIP